jgi:Tfp pilus assembly protein PilV
MARVVDYRGGPWECDASRKIAHARAGITLLEVLVACGILVIGLSSIAALLPAAGSRLAQATQADRAGIMSAHAYADVVNRGLLGADLFSSGTKACVFGKGLTGVPLVSASAAAVTATAAAAIISSTTAAAVGIPATLSIAVFKKEGGPPQAIALTQASGMFKLTAPDESTLKRFFGGCSYVLALSKDPTQQPRWFRITASWKQLNAADCWVVFADHSGMVSFAGTSPTVLGFENLMRVDQYPVTLD